MKNPINYLKHLLKDPINTLEEADARKKEIMPWLFGSIGVAVLFSVLDGILSTGFLMIFGMIGVFGVMFFGFLLFVIGKAKERFKVLTCDGCNTMAVIKTPEEFAQFVHYTVEKDEASYNGVSHPASNNGVVSKVEAKGSASAVVSIELKCPNCGKVRKLEYRITPFKCTYTQEKVLVRDVEAAKMRLETGVKEVVAAYNDPEKRKLIPYSIHSRNNPNYENRTKPQFANNHSAYPTYNGVKINYHKDVEEMVEQFFLENQLDGTISAK